MCRILIHTILLFCLPVFLSCIRAAENPRNIVDEPIGAVYSLGMTLWHMGHNPDMIPRFHEFLKKSGYSPDNLLPSRSLIPPLKTREILLDPGMMTYVQLTENPAVEPALARNWFSDGDWLESNLGH